MCVCVCLRRNPDFSKKAGHKPKTCVSFAFLSDGFEMVTSAEQKTTHENNKRELPLCFPSSNSLFSACVCENLGVFLKEKTIEPMDAFEHE